MGVRLYPATKNPVVLARLAGVSLFTQAILLPIHDRIDSLITRAETQALNTEWRYPGYKLIGLALRKLFPNTDLSFELYSFVSDHFPQVRKANSFDLYGWGRLDGAWDFMEAHGWYGADYVAGHVTKVMDVLTILTLKGIKLPTDLRVKRLGGLCWG